MNISLNWLAQYVQIPDSIVELETLLTNVGLEVESVVDRRRGLAGIVVGKVESCDKHPNADKLSVCTVFDGTERHTVVCGAPNVLAGQTVAFAPLGTQIATLGFTIERKKIRGVASAGMICSAAELGISDDHSGIMILPDRLDAGTPLATALPHLDVMLEIGITPNRGDALSHVGIARDIAAVTRTSLRIPAVRTDGTLKTSGFQVEIRVPDLCPRYSCAIVRGARNGPSPDWLRQRLESAGMRPVSLLVDITNFVMMEIGQPMHAFDLARLEGGRITVRVAVAGERFGTLDGAEHTLPAGALLICDAAKPVALAGVMGGINSEISASTTDVLLESAHFHPSSVRKTAKALGVSTESSYRFERGTDPDRTVWALQRAVDMIVELAGGSYEGIVDANPNPRQPAGILLRPARVGDILGITIDPGRQREILESLEIRTAEAENGFLCEPPGFRSDLEREIDLIEEIARIHGYDSIGLPQKIEIHAGRQFDDEALADQLRSSCLALGFDEVLTSSLIPRDLAGLFSGDVVEVLNPVSADRPALRPSLFPSILETVDHNIRNGTRTLRLFEIGTGFTRGREESLPAEEHMILAMLMTGNAEHRSWHSAERPMDFFDLKGAFFALLEKFDLDKETAIAYDADESLGGRGYIIQVQGVTIGRIMQFPHEILNRFDIDQAVYGAELHLTPFSKLATSERKMQPISRFPVVQRDLAFILDVRVDAEAIIRTIQAAGSRHLRDIDIIDIFQHQDFGRNRKSVAVSMAFQSDDRTLSEQDIAPDVEGILRALERDHNATLRA